MGAFGPIHWLILAVVVLLLFGGKGKIAGIMGDTAKGIKAFKDGLKDDEHKAGPGTLPRTDAEKEDIRREEAKHST
ncbi:MAG: twin-arginine translocation protein TatA/E family subunit [Caulobacteraceae bacterium]|jgi:sec-independent protein translocase protein TatA|nr:twin-arginine translocation protein TatA/E family subunit [Caulobacteraceae bacterium]